MKNITFFVSICLILMISTSAIAGDKIGFRAGYHSAMIYDKDGSKLSGVDPLSNLYLGIYKDNRIVPLLRFGFGLEYFQNGVNIKASDEKYAAHYLSVPVHLKVKAGPVFAQTGISGNIKVSESLPSGTTDDSKPKSFDAPFHIGGGFSFLVFKIEARYHWGLTDLNDAGDRNRYLQIGAAVSF